MTKALPQPWNRLGTFVVVGVVLWVVMVGAPGMMATAAGGPTDDAHVVADDPESDCEADFESIQAAVDAAEPGDTVLVCAGEYAEEVDISTPNVTVRASGDAVVRADDPDREHYGFTIRASGVTVRGFEIENSTAWVRPTGDQRLHNSSIQGNTFVNGSIVVNESSTHTTIRDNSVDHSRPFLTGGDTALTIMGNHTIVQNNSVRFSGHSASAVSIRRQADGTRLVDNTLTHESDSGGWVVDILAQETVVRGNNISGGGTGVKVRAGATTQRAPNDTEITGNTITDTGTGIEVRGSGTKIIGGTMIRENIISDVDWKGITVNFKTANSEIRANTISGVTEAGSATGVEVRGNDTEVAGNTVTESRVAVMIWTKVIGETPVNPVESAHVVDNRLTGNRHGLVIGCRPSWHDGRCDGTDPSEYEVTGNRFEDTEAYAIYNGNRSATLNAPNNDWGPDGMPGSPPEGSPLADPRTDRVANGTGGWVSESADPGTSNVHFSPPGPEEGDPAGTPSPTPTPTPTPTPDSRTGTPPADDGANDEDDPGEATPVPEPGFGAGAVLVGFGLLLAVLLARHRRG